MDSLKADGTKNERQRNPRADANFFEVITFSWMLKIFKTGWKRELNENDLYTTLKDHRSSQLGDELEKRWRIEVASAKQKNRNPSLLRVLLQMFGPDIILNGSGFAAVSIILQTSQPLLIGELLTYFNPEGFNRINKEYAYMYALSLSLSLFISLILFHYVFSKDRECGMKIRVACCSMVYRKTLRLHHEAISKISDGLVINLLSNDANRFDIATFYLHYLWIGPLHTIVVTYFLWQEIGMSSLFGVATFLFFIPLQGWLGKKMASFRLNVAHKTDERLRLINEVISGIQVIKMYTWEKSFANLIERARKKEIRKIKESTYIKAVLTSFVVVQSRFQIFICILSFVLLGNYISIEKVFVTISFFNLLTITMSNFFCRGLGLIAEVLVSIKRIQSFVLREEKKNEQVKNTSNSDKTQPYDFNKLIKINDNLEIKKKGAESNTEHLKEFGIDISNATAKWVKDQTVNSIENINLTVKNNGLVAIIGSVGAGKSSLLQVILKELPLFEGNLSVRGVVSYASQKPWLFAGTVRQNIIFDSPMDEERYKEVVKVCALKNDFEQFPYGDCTIVGERGVTLSGGQRSRISLARAVYKRANIYLLDDPLSAVDTLVGKHLLEHCIKGFLREKICILITHQIQLLTEIDQIVLMENSRILAEGSYQELQISDLGFMKLLETKDEIQVESFGLSHSINSKCPKIGSNLSIQNSNKSVSSLIDDNNGTLIPDKSTENPKSRLSKSVSKSVYLSYFSAGGSVFKLFFLFLMYILSQVLTSGSDYWITIWVNKEAYVFQNQSSVFNNSSDSLTMKNIRHIYIIVYSVIIISLIVAVLIRSSIFVSVCTTSSTNLHNRMFNNVIRATMLFFNTHSSGQIFQHFSNDIGDVDEFLPSTLLECFQMLMFVLGVVFVVGIVNLYLIVPTFIVTVILFYIRAFYLPLSRSAKRLDGITRSPIYAHLNASIQGLTTIRAYQAESILSNEFDKYQDSHSSAWYLMFSSNGACALWLDFVCMIYIVVVLISYFVIGNSTYGGNIGLVITQSMTIMGRIQWGVFQSATLDNQMKSVERVLDYIKVPKESALKSSSDIKPSKDWPNKGQIEFKNFYLRYTSDTSTVLKNINILIQPSEKIGIVGRTGAGKSSIIGALFRLALNEGEIIVDDVEIHKLGLHDLRSIFSIIPQEPVLFSGTIRRNLDPFEEYPDHILWNALDEMELKVMIENLPGGLNSKISESGSNFSVGQRQLICLARAIIRNNKILVLDEATANVDPQTDALIQNTIKSKFRKCTVLTIAHRLNTVIDSDKIIVIDAGTVVEFDHPHNLLKNKNGHFYKMIQRMGQDTANILHNAAAESFYKMQTNSFINSKSCHYEEL